MFFFLANIENATASSQMRWLSDCTVAMGRMKKQEEGAAKEQQYDTGVNITQCQMNCSPRVISTI